MAEEADMVSVEKDTCTTCKNQIATGFCEKCTELACIQHLKVIFTGHRQKLLQIRCIVYL